MECSLPLIPMYLMQSILCYIFALILGMKFSINIIFAVLINLPAAVLFISLGLLAGSIFNDKQVGSIVGAWLTNVSTWLSGTWLDLSLMGGSFRKAAYLLPFANAVSCKRATLSGYFSSMWKFMIITATYGIGVFILAVIIFSRKMKRK